MTDCKDIIINCLFDVKRANIDSLIHWLEKDTDFFSAPASTKYHGAFKGGLAEHSFNVYRCLCDITVGELLRDKLFNTESMIIVALLHDVCKTNFYKESLINVKDEKGAWVQVPFYQVEDSEPYGHGEKSVMLIEKHIRLTDEERYSIRWHMGGFDESVKGGSYAIGKAYEKYPLAVALHLADMMATYIIERERSSNDTI